MATARPALSLSLCLSSALSLGDTAPPLSRLRLQHLDEQFVHVDLAVAARVDPELLDDRVDLAQHGQAE